MRPLPRLLLCCGFLLSAISARASVYEVRGLTEPIGDVYLSTTVSGVISVINCEEGSFVEAGSTILELDSRMEEIEVERRNTLLENLRTELARSELLFETSSSIAREEVEKKRSEFRIATAEYNLAREHLGKRRIITPIAGLVTDLPLAVGEYCEPPKVVVRVVDSRRFYFNTNLDPMVGGALKVGDTVSLNVSDPESVITVNGEVTYVAPVVDPASGLMRIRAVFENTDGRVRPGVAGTLSIQR